MIQPGIDSQEKAVGEMRRKFSRGSAREQAGRGHYRVHAGGPFFSLAKRIHYYQSISLPRIGERNQLSLITDRDTLAPVLPADLLNEIDPYIM